MAIYNSEEDEWTGVGHLSVGRDYHAMSLVPSSTVDFCVWPTTTTTTTATTTTTTTTTTTEEAQSIYLYSGVGDHDDSYDATEDHSDATEHHDDANDASEDAAVDEVGNSSEILRNLSLASTNSTAAGHLASRLFQGNTFTMV